MQKIYYDPADTPADGKLVLVTNDRYPRFQGRGASLEDAFRNYLDGTRGDPDECIFRRVARGSSEHELSVWEIDPPKRGNMAKSRHDLSGARLLGCYNEISTLEKTVRIDPTLAQKYGVVEVYMRAEWSSDNYCYLDRTGKIRPVRLIVDGMAIEPGTSDEDLKEAIEDAIIVTLEPLFQIAEDS